MQEIEAALCEFIEAVVHECLFLRIYPKELFQRHRLYNIVVQRARHPRLCQYITGVVASIMVSSGKAVRN